MKLRTSESVVADARKQAAPEVRQVKQTVSVPKTKWVKRYVDATQQTGSEKRRVTDVDDSERLKRQQQQLTAVQPNKPLPLQQ